MQAIITKFFVPGNVGGSRIKATAGGHSITIGYRHDLDTEEAHVAAALALAKKMGWKGTLIGGGLKTGFAFVLSTSTPSANIPA